MRKMIINNNYIINLCNVFIISYITFIYYFLKFDFKISKYSRVKIYSVMKKPIS